MKINTQITVALLALGIVTQASAADPVVYLTGSSAFRSTVFKALSDNTSGPTNSVFQAGSVTWGSWGNSTPGSANYMVFHGTLANGQAVYVDCAWSGSEAGIASACDTTLANTDRNGNPLNLAGSPETWVDVTNATIQSGGYVQSSNPNPAGSGTGTVGAELEPSSHGSDLAQADTSQAVSWTPPVAGTKTALINYGSEGVVTFTISKNVNPAPTQAWLDCTNITLPQIVVMTADGVVPASFLTGNPADGSTAVYLVGRNKGSGTRMNYLSCSTYGPHNPVSQYSIGYGCGDPGDPAQNPSFLYLTNEDNNGYESGGGVAKALADTGGSDASGSCQQADPFGNGTNWFALGYLSPSDALSPGNNGNQPTPLYCNTNNWVTIDGVTSDNQNIENGSFWYWGHEHLYGRYNITAGSIQDDVAKALFSAVQGQMVLAGYGVAPGGHDAGIPYGLMHVSKASDTAFPSF